jgi:hypothetical protein
MTLAMGVVFWSIAHSSAGAAQAAILLPALIMGLSQGRAFSSSWGELTECLGYLGHVFDFLDQSFDDSALAVARPATLASRPPALATAAYE